MEVRHTVESKVKAQQNNVFINALINDGQEMTFTLQYRQNVGDHSTTTVITQS